ncbi:MAG: HNH endonuclease, partial [Nitrososphaera sp.]|nr:HNH endonuclease [Nitrososphaera sp.]
KFKERNRNRSLAIYWSDPEYYRMKQRSRHLGVLVDTIREVYDRDKVCQMCFADESLTIDHMHPHSRGGRGIIDNLQLLCRACNGWKSDRLMLPNNGGVLL